MAATTWSQLRCSGHINSLYRISEHLRQQDGRSRVELELDDQIKTPSHYYFGKCRFMYNVQSIVTFGEDRDPYGAVENAAVACYEILKGLARCDSELQRIIVYCENNSTVAPYTLQPRHTHRDMLHRALTGAPVLPSAPPLEQLCQKQNEQQ